jgi:hypothetical protein
VRDVSKSLSWFSCWGGSSDHGGAVQPRIMRGGNCSERDGFVCICLRANVTFIDLTTQNRHGTCLNNNKETGYYLLDTGRDWQDSVDFSRNLFWLESGSEQLMGHGCIVEAGIHPQNGRRNFQRNLQLWMKSESDILSFSLVSSSWAKWTDSSNMIW